VKPTGCRFAGEGLAGVCAPTGASARELVHPAWAGGPRGGIIVAWSDRPMRRKDFLLRASVAPLAA